MRQARAGQPVPEWPEALRTAYDWLTEHYAGSCLPDLTDLNDWVCGWVYRYMDGRLLGLVAGLARQLQQEVSPEERTRLVEALIRRKDQQEVLAWLLDLPAAVANS